MLRIFSILFFWLTFVPFIQSQSIFDDFEGNGTINSWFGDDCVINTKFSNPFSQGINTSSNVLKYEDIGGQYANVRFDLEENLDLIEHHTFSLKIFVSSQDLSGTQINQISLKLQDGKTNEPWNTQSEIIKPINLNQWQVVSFNFKYDAYINLNPSSLPPTQRKDFNRIVIQVNGENNNSKVIAYIDDFYFDNTSEPTVYDLVWSDEFDNNGEVDNTKWFHQTKLPDGVSWYNGEIQHYTNRTTNSKVEDGILKIIAKKETFNDQGQTKHYTSARLNSKFAFTYGKVEVRAKLPSGIGTWPAIWLLGKNINENGAYWQQQEFGTTPWPACGEIDIMEHWGHNQNFVQSAIHTPSSFGNTVNHGGQSIATSSDEFHIYSMVWTKEKIIFAVDDKVHFVYLPTEKNASTWPFDSDQYVLFNFAIQPTILPSFNEDALEIDYIRIFQESPISSLMDKKNTNISYFPNPVDDILTIKLEQNVSHSVHVNISNIDGHMVFSNSYLSSNNEIKVQNLDRLQKGMYIVSYEVNKKWYSFKMIKG